MEEQILIEWFQKWRKPIRSWLGNRASIPPSEVDDLAQEVFLRLIRYSDDSLVDNPQGYLYRIAANVANEWRDRSRISKPHDDSWLEELQIETSDEPEEICAKEIEHRLLQSIIDAMPPRRRMILLMHVNEKLTYGKIAELKGLSYRIVLRELTNAYSTLRRTLNPTDLR